ncbi:NAD(P)/FAD-dependent oxidoreductase [Luteolibacter algae]|uniref:NAD(P)/FAD-dependent oxidoreductase n=2 Tax=Luteolibacter algae TaxID=454151 RepID=A0ABW5D566_9BACT
MMNHRDPRPIDGNIDRSADYDVVVIGGAFSGSSSALLLKRQFKDLRILIIERSGEFNRKVGESTSEVAGCFLTRILRIGMHLNAKHVAKHGLRMWFHKDGQNAPGRSTELGPAFQGRLPTFQLNRITLDSKILQEATDLGCELARPATIRDLELGGIGKNKVSFKTESGEIREVTATWVIDASGKAAKIAKLRKTWNSNATQHPTSAIWTRFTNVSYLDSHEAVAKMEGLSSKVIAQRGSATNHLMGFGWWCWIIPLDSGEVSVGLTWDSRLFTPPTDGSMAERLKTHILKHPVGKVMFENAIPVEGDNCYYKDLAYWSEEVAGEGWTTVGDACGFMDPLYSQGLDYCSHTVYSSYTLLRNYYSGKCVKEGIAKRNKEFKRSYFDWFNALYKDKYWYLGDAELMYAAFLMDVGTYFIGPVRGVYTNEDVEFEEMPYSGAIGHAFAVFMALYNRRLVKIAKKKITAEVYGDKNLDESYLILGSFNPDPSSFKLITKGIKIWLRLELKYLFTPATKKLPEHSMNSPLPYASTSGSAA